MTLLHTCLFGLLLAFVHAPIAIQTPATATYEVNVVLHIDGLDEAMLTRLGRQVAKERTVTIEYSCLASGVVVLRFAESPVNERADVVTVVRRQLTAAGIERGVEFLHVHAEARGPGKC